MVNLAHRAMLITLIIKNQIDMKRIIIFAIVAISLGVIGHQANRAVKPTHVFTETELQNIEALTQDENSSASWPCWSKAKKSDGGFWRCGSPCVWVDGLIGTGTESRCYSN